MNALNKKMLRAAACAAVAIGAASAGGGARADAFAQSILVIDNFRLLHANGTPYTAGDFTLLTGASGAYANGQLNGVLSSAMQAADLSSGFSVDVAHQSVGDGALLRPENDFSRLAVTPGSPASFGSADQRMAGNLITTNLGAAGAQLQSRADAALAANGAALGSGSVSGATAFNFALGAGEFMTIAFDAQAFTQAYAAESSGNRAGAQARLAWSVSVLDLTTGTTVFTFAPEQLNGLSNVNRNDGAGGIAVYDPGTLSFAATTGLLSAGDAYQVTFAQTSFASALQGEAVPEPAMLALFGAGLLAMAALGRRRAPRRS